MLRASSLYAQRRVAAAESLGALVAATYHFHRRGAGRPTVAGHITTAVRLAPAPPIVRPAHMQRVDSPFGTRRVPGGQFQSAPMSALPSKADIGLHRADCVRFVGAPRLDLVADGVGEAPSRQPRSETRALCCIEFKHY